MPLPHSEDDDEDGSANKESDDTTGAPWVGQSAPLKSHEKHDYSWDEKRSPDQVEPRDARLERFQLRLACGRVDYKRNELSLSL